MNIPPRHLRMFLAQPESPNFSKTNEQRFMAQPSLAHVVVPQLCAEPEQRFQAPQIAVHDCASAQATCSRTTSLP